MNQYKLTFTVALEEQDDPAARKQAREIIEAMSEVVTDADVSLKQVFKDRPPKGIRMA